MPIQTKTINLNTKGFTDIIDITHKVREIVKDSGLQDGQVLIFIPGSTGGVTTIEYEPGLLKDLPEAFERLAPIELHYHHNETWHDGNGFSHVRAVLLGASLTVPFTQKRLLLGTWQQIVVMDFDNKARQRKVIIQVSGE